MFGLQDQVAIVLQQTMCTHCIAWILGLVSNDPDLETAFDGACCFC